MKTVEFEKPLDGDISLALGYFDCVHLGHRAILQKTLELAESRGSIATVSTFYDAPNRAETVYDYRERIRLFAGCGLEACISVYYLKVCNTCGKDFLDKMTSLYSVRDFVCGENYTYGCDKCNVEDLKSYCEEKGINLVVVPLLDCKNVRVSTTAIKAFLRVGDVDSAGRLLGTPYHVRGEVVGGDGRGHRIGLPTVNLNLSPDMMEIKRGVYGTYTLIDGKQYRSVTNYGSRPTFLQSKFAVETHVIGYDGESLLGKEVTVSFYKYLRSIMKFETAEALVATVRRDMEWKDV